MRILLYSDNHWSQYSSIVRGRGERYSLRLENQIASINWAERLSESNNCDYIVCLGDFFDKESLNSEELTALTEIKWADKQHAFLVGNHEMGINNLIYSSAHVLGLGDNLSIVNSPSRFFVGDTEVCFIPYIMETNREPIGHYLSDKVKSKRLLLTHNDIKGVQMGGFISQIGFDVEELESCCDLCINGHLHNGGFVSDTVVNIGNLTGQNFGEDAKLYSHSALIVDTDTLRIEEFVNPFAFNFYKFDMTYEWHSLRDIDEMIEENKNLIKTNAVVTVKVNLNDVDKVRNWLNNDSNIVTSRVVVNMMEESREEPEDYDDLSIDHIKAFEKYVLTNIGNNDIIKHELQEVVR